MEIIDLGAFAALGYAPGDFPAPCAFRATFSRFLSTPTWSGMRWRRSPKPLLPRCRSEVCAFPLQRRSPAGRRVVRKPMSHSADPAPSEIPGGYA